MNKRPGVYIKTFGCQMNEYDTAKLYKILEGHYGRVENEADADLLLINTCSVRDKPEQKVYSQIGRYNKLKKQNPDLLIGVGGCVAQQEGTKIIKRSKAVDFVFGTHNLSLVPSLINLRKQGSSPQVAVDYRDEWEDLPLGFSETDKVSAFVTISRGCNKKCSFCIVPTTRGPEVSRDPKEIEREIRLAVRKGVKEVVLLGQTVNSYGKDLPQKISFADLLHSISEIDGLEWIRFTSPHPQEVKKDFLDLFSRNPKICRHIHLPLQSGSNSILKSMRRSYKRERYLEIVDSLRERVPDIAITSDIIVGFPGETEADFMETVEILEQVRFSSTYSFMFSPRPGTHAEKLEGRIEEEEMLRRLHFFQKRQQEITQEILSSFKGEKVRALLDSSSSHDNEILQGRISQNLTANLDKSYPDLKRGDFVFLEIFGAGKHTLKARFSSH